MKLDGRQYLSIDDSVYRLPQDLHQANSSEAGSSPLGFHNHFLTCTQCREFSYPEGRMYGGDDLLLVSWAGVFLLCCCSKPHPEVFGPHSRWASVAM